MQIAGSACKVCNHNIALASEGKFCPHCQTVVHLTCESDDTCRICGQRYEGYERPKFDPLTDAVLPPALRPARSAGPALAISVAALFGAMLLLIWYCLMHMTAK